MCASVYQCVPVYLCNWCPVRPLLAVLTNVSVSPFNGTLPFDPRTVNKISLEIIQICPPKIFILPEHTYSALDKCHILELKYWPFKRQPCVL